MPCTLGECCTDQGDNTLKDTLHVLAFAGTTSQPSMGAIVNALYGTPLDTGIDPLSLARLSIYWEQVGCYRVLRSRILMGGVQRYCSSNQCMFVIRHGSKQYCSTASCI
jgi:pyruvate carboxylase